MNGDLEYRLCGGILLTLLLRARKQRTAARKNASGEKDGLSDNQLFCALIQVAFPNFMPPAGRSFATYTSDYKACRLSSNEYLPFFNAELLSRFDAEVKTNFPAVRRRMADFIASYLNAEDFGNWLIRALLETIKKDPSTLGEVFYIHGGETGIDRNDLLAEHEFCLSEFMVGIWHYILMHCSDNKAGRTTYEMWHKPAATPKGRRVFISDVGKNWESINVVPVSESENLVSEEDDDEYRDPYDVPEDTIPVILPNAQIAPELTGDAPWIMIDRDLLPGNWETDAYLENAYEKYSKVKTLLYSDSPLEFYDFLCLQQSVPENQH